MKRVSVVIVVIGVIGVALFLALVLISERTEAARLWGYVDRSGEVVIPVSFDDADAFSQGLAAVSVGGRWGFIDPGGRLAVEPRFLRVGRFTAEGIAWAEEPDAARENNAVGYIQRDGSWAIEPRFDLATGFENGVAIAGLVVGLTTTRISGSMPTRIYSFGVIDRAGAWIVPPLDNSEPSYWSDANQFAGGLAAVRPDGQGYGYVDASGTFVIPPEFDQARTFSEGRALTRTGSGEYRVITPTGEALLAVGVSSAWLGSDGFISLYGSLGEDEGWFLADTTGAIHTGPYESMGTWSEGRVPVEDDGRWYLIDAEGTRYGDGWDAMESVSEGLAAVGQSGRGLFADYEWGFVDTNGTVVIEPAFNRAGPFVEGLARVALLDES